MTRARTRRHFFATCVLLLGAVLGCSTTSGAPGSGAGSGVDAGGEGGSPSASTVAGTVTLPADANGRCVMVALDNDTTGSNGSARRGDGSYLLGYQRVAGQTVEFAFDAVPAGSYFLWGYVDTDSSSSSATGDCEINGAPESGDFLGYYDTGLAPPSAANVTVPDAASARYDFQVGVFP